MALPEHIQKERNEAVEKIIRGIQEGKPFFWDSGHYGNGRPRNIIVGTGGKTNYYKGINTMRLTLAKMEHGFKDGRWGTYRQAQMLGGNVRVGEKGTHIEYWQYTKDLMEKDPKTGKNKPVYDLDPKTGQMKKKQIVLAHPIVKFYTVFNAEQMDGIPAEHEITINEKDKNLYMENMLKNSEAKIFYDQSNRNFYRPGTDEIHVMDRVDFKTMDAFYATVAHEIAHSTGAEYRLNRETLTSDDAIFGTPEYAKEELRAEMTSMFLQQEYSIKFDEEHFKNHAAYLQSWAKDLHDDPNEIYRAAADAEKAVDYIKANMLEKNLDKSLLQQIKETSKEEEER